MIRMHDESIKDSLVSMTKLLGKRSYLKWLGKQPMTLGI